jgi:hypothetical protein
MLRLTEPADGSVPTEANLDAIRIDQMAGVQVSKDMEGKWEGSVVVGHTLFFTPFNAPGILRFDHDSQTASLITTAQYAAGAGKWKGAVVLDGFIYCAPYNASGILRFSVPTDDEPPHMTFISTEKVCQGNAKWSCVVAHNRSLYFVPCRALCILRLDVPPNGDAPNERNMFVIDLPKEAVQTSHRWSSAFVLGDTIYCAPMDGQDVLCIDTTKVPEVSVKAAARPAARPRNWLTTVLSFRVVQLCACF